jgi:hypothetical protein
LDESIRILSCAQHYFENAGGKLVIAITFLKMISVVAVNLLGSVTSALIPAAVLRF